MKKNKINFFVSILLLKRTFRFAFCLMAFRFYEGANIQPFLVSKQNICALFFIFFFLPWLWSNWELILFWNVEDSTPTLSHFSIALAIEPLFELFLSCPSQDKKASGESAVVCFFSKPNAQKLFKFQKIQILNSKNGPKDSSRNPKV